MISEIYSSESYLNKQMLQVEIAQCSGDINSFITDKYGFISFDEQSATKLITNKYKYCNNLANAFTINDNPIYLRFDSTEQSTLTHNNEFLVQLNYVPIGKQNAYNCLYPGNNGKIKIDKSDSTYIQFQISIIEQQDNCNQNSFTYEILGYWVSFDQEQNNVLCSLNIQSSSIPTYYEYLNTQVGASPNDFYFLIPYKTLSTNPNDNFFIGIKALVSVKYQEQEVIENNYTFTYQFEQFNLVPIDKSKGNSGLSAGQKAGIAIGVICGVAIIAVGVWWVIKRRRSRNESLLRYNDAAL